MEGEESSEATHSELASHATQRGALQALELGLH